MKKKTYLKKTATLILTLALLSVLPGKLPPTEPVPGTSPAFENTTGEGTEPGIQPLDDRNPTEKVKK